MNKPNIHNKDTDYAGAYIEKRVHELYWKDDINCARTSLTCLSELFHVTLEPQTIRAAIGLHGAGGFRAQCGLVEGGLMFIGVYFSQLGQSESDIADLCYQYADAFQQYFHSLKCYDLRPTGFSDDDPPHMCEQLTCRGIQFAYEYVKKKVESK